MVKRAIVAFFAIFLILTLAVSPVAAAVIDGVNGETEIVEAYSDLYANALVKQTLIDVSVNGERFTMSPGISYPYFGSQETVDPNGYTVFVRVLTSEIQGNNSFLVQFSAGYAPYPSFTLTERFDAGDYTYFYEHFSLDDFYFMFGSYTLPIVLNIFARSDVTGYYTELDWAFSPASNFDLFKGVVDSVKSYDNGYAGGLYDGTTIRDNLFTLAEPVLEYYHQGVWHQIDVDFPEDLSPYVTYNAVYLNLIQNLGLTASDIPANNGGIRLCFEIQRPINVAGFRFGAYNPSNIIRRYDPADIRSDRFGVWFSNSEFGYDLWPYATVEEDGAKYWFKYTPYADRVYDQISIELNYQVLINVLNNSQVLTDYVEYQLIDYNEPFDAGYDQGYQNGKFDGEKIGEKNGYQKGYRDGLSIAENSEFNDLFSAVIDVPIQAFYGLLDFTFLGVNLSSFVLSGLTLVLVILVLKKVIL